MLTTYGVHHLSSMVGHAQKNIDFYARVLKNRLVKQTLNFDDKNMYHLYYSNHDASSGLITTFPMNNTTEGCIGAGQVAVARYAIRPETLSYLENILESSI